MPLAVPQIRPISDLRSDLNDVCEMAKESQQPIFMTKNGKASLVVIDCEAYEEEHRRARYVQKLREAEIEEKYRTEAVSRRDVSESMERLFKHWGV